MPILANAAELPDDYDGWYLVVLLETEEWKMEDDGRSEVGGAPCAVVLVYLSLLARWRSNGCSGHGYSTPSLLSSSDSKRVIYQQNERRARCVVPEVMDFLMLNPWRSSSESSRVVGVTWPGHVYGKILELDEMWIRIQI